MCETIEGIWVKKLLKAIWFCKRIELKIFNNLDEKELKLVTFFFFGRKGGYINYDMNSSITKYTLDQF